ncbi:hypothetical protein [Frigoriglobus tundricola]|uniref:hypothetical protein n=1 Tax=Frigoriglobus tundricola TaxID=2774151 RepID=UPI00148EE7CE|nr:hypothetical protein [Frigoriglobus tundricola]
MIACVGFVLVLVVLLWLLPVPVDTYKQLRGSLFTGIFAVSGFLLSAKSLVILNMKKEIYGEEWYLNRIHDRDWSSTEHGRKSERAKREACGITSAVYRPLAQVGALLTVNIIMALIAAFAQITLGLAETEVAVAVCLAFAFSTALLLGCSVYLMWLNFETMYAEWEAIAQAKLEKKWNASLDEFHEAAVHPTPGSPAKVKTVEAEEELPPPK